MRPWDHSEVADNFVAVFSRSLGLSVSWSLSFSSVIFVSDIQSNSCHSLFESALIGKVLTNAVEVSVN